MSHVKTQHDLRLETKPIGRTDSMALEDYHKLKEEQNFREDDSTDEPDASTEKTFHLATAMPLSFHYVQPSLGLLHHSSEQIRLSIALGQVFPKSVNLQ